MRKLFTLLTLLVVCVTGAWADDPVFGEANSICLNISKYSTISTATFTSNLTNLYYYDSSNGVLVVNGYGAINSTGQQKWVTVDSSGSAGRTGWSATGVFKGAEYYGYQSGGLSSGNPRVSALNNSRKNIFEVTNCTQVSALVKSGGTGSGRYVKMAAYEMNAEGTAKASAEAVKTQNGTNSNNIETISLTGLDASKIYQIELTGNVSDNSDLYEIAFYAPTGPTITTQPVSANYATNASATALSVVATASAGNLSYQWKSCTDVNKTGAAAISNETSATYTPSTASAGTFYYYCTVTDGNGSKDSQVATITVSAASAPSNLNVSGTPEASVNKNASVTLTASASGVPTPTYEWFKCDDTSKSNPVSVGTNVSYSPSTSSLGTSYYYVVASNGVGEAATSDVQTVTVIGRSDCLLSKVMYSNGFDAFIKQPSGEDHGTIKAYYMSGESEPTISSVTVSDGATYNVNGSTLTVRAEDETTTSVFDITISAVNPGTAVGSLTFDGEETWVKTGGAYLNTDNKKGWTINKNTEESSNRRISEGKNRIYLFLNKSKSVTIYPSSTNGSARNVSYTINGETAASGSFPAYNSTSLSGLKITTGSKAMIGITNLGSGDMCIGSIDIEIPSSVSDDITASGYNTYSSNYPLDLSTISGGTAYVATSVTDGKVVLTKCTGKVPAATGLFIAGTAGETFTISTTNDETTAPANNLFVGAPSGKTVSKADDGEFNYVFGWTEVTNPGFYLISGTAATLGNFKAYLHTTTALNAPISLARLGISFFDDITGISQVESSAKSKDGVIFDLQGRRVVQPTKGLYIVNGKKYINQ